MQNFVMIVHMEANKGLANWPFLTEINLMTTFCLSRHHLREGCALQNRLISVVFVANF